jgi:uncharacterized FlgJ-related protein
MFYKYDEKQLRFVKNKLGIRIALGTTILLMVGSFFIGRYTSGTLTKYERDYIHINWAKERNTINREKLAKELKECGIKFPHIIMAQAIIESARFTSELYKNNNNLFGMMIPGSRNTTNIAANGKYAKYDTWQRCVLDMGYLQQYNLKGVRLNTDEDYFIYLKNSNYAEATNYISALKKTIQTENLKSYFNE